MRVFIALGSVVISIISIVWFLSVATDAEHYYIVIAAFSVLSVWALSSFTLHKIYKLSLIEAFKLDALTYLASLGLFVYLLRLSFTNLDSSKIIKLSTGIGYITFVYAKMGLLLYLYKKNRMSGFGVSPAKMGVALFLFVFAFYAALALWTGFAIAPTGDEPYYLLAAKSLITDYDLDISNNYSAGQWKSFMPAGYSLLIWPSPRPDGRIYMDERILFIAFLAIPYLLGGFLGTSLFMVLLSSVLIFLIYRYMLNAGFESARSFWVSLLIAGTPPMLNMSSRVYHNVLGAVLILSAFLFLNYKSGTTAAALITAVIILALPWVHIIYIAFSLTLFFLFFVFYRQRKRLLGIFLLLGILDAAVFFVYRAHIRAGIADIAVISQYQLTPHIYRSLLALLFDQESGLFFVAPVYIFFLIGFVSTLVIDRSIKLLTRIIFAISGYLIVQGSLPAFGGGYGAGRLLIQILPFMAIFLRRCFEKNRFNPLVYALSIISIFIGYVMIAVPWLAVNYETGSNIFLKQFSAIYPLDISKYLPSFYVPGQEYYPFILLFLVIAVIIGSLNKPQFSWR